MSKLNWKYLLFGTWLLFLFAGIRILTPLITDSYIMFSELSQIKHQIRSSTSVKKEIQAIQSENEKLESRIHQILTEVPSSTKISRIYDALGNYADSNDVILAQISPQPIHKGREFNMLDIESTAHAKFSDIVSFINVIESQKKFFQVQELEIIPLGKNSSTLKCQLNLSAYLRQDL